jgi:nucleotide-binding universal stress UspA family protein
MTTNELVLCAVDRSPAGPVVLEAAKRTGAPVLMVHVANSLLGTEVPAFVDDAEGTERMVCHGPTGPGLLGAAAARDASMIVLGSRGRLWPSVARYVVARAGCPVMVVGPHADPHQPVELRPVFDRRLVRRSRSPVLILPQD